MPIHNPLWEVAEPYFVRAGAYTVKDPTYGRYLLGHHTPTAALLATPGVKHTWRRLFLRPEAQFPTWEAAYSTTEIMHSEDVQLTADEIVSGAARGGRWVFYSVWEMDEPAGGWEAGGKGVGKDLVLVHGLSDYGLRYAPHVLHFLKAGFRCIMPDLPSYGRSTGPNSYIPSMHLLPAAVHCVLIDVINWDKAHGRAQHPVFLSGASMGGWTCLYYLLKMPDDSEKDAEGVVDIKPHVHVIGAFILCPMVEVSKQSRPSYLIELIAKGIKIFAGSLPLASAVRGNVSDDPKVEEDFFSDPLCYHGLLRVGTGLALLDGMIELDKGAEKIDIPIRLVHGNADRATSFHGTEKLFERLPNADKQLEIYDGYEHVMIKVGVDAADDAKRQRVLKDWRDWLVARC